MRILARTASVLLGAVFAIGLLTPSASAHAELVRTEPADGSSLSEAPQAVRLWFSEDISPEFRSAQLVDRSGQEVTGARLADDRDPRRVTLLLPPLTAGVYGVLWQVLSEDDGHSTQGAVVFQVGQAAGTPGIAADLTSGTSESTTTPLDVARRWLGICLLAGLVGALAVVGLVLGQIPAVDASGELAGTVRAGQDRLLALAAWCAGLGAVVGVADLATQTQRVAPTVADHSPAVALVDLLASARWGHLWLVREAVLVAVAVLVLTLRSLDRRRYGPGRLRPAVVAALVLVLVAVEALGSHAAALGPGRNTAIVADGLHILAACLWLGALPALVVALWPPSAPSSARRALVRAGKEPFTRLAATSVVIVVATGLYGAGREVEAVDRLFTSTYGRTLLLKSTLLVVMCGLGLANSLRLHGRGPSRRLILAEAGVGAVLLAAVGLLVQTPPATGPVSTAAGAPVSEQEAISTMVNDLVVSVSVTPNRPGTNAFTVSAASSRRPPPTSVDGLRLELTQGSDLSTVPLRQVEPGRWFGTGDLGRSGPVQFRAMVQRGPQNLVVRLDSEVEPPASAEDLAPGARRLAPYVNALGLATLLLGLAAGTGWLLGVRPRPRQVDVVSPPQPAEKVPEGIR